MSSIREFLGEYGVAGQGSVVVIGAGLAGLCCARRLAQCGIDCMVIEAADGPGGRVRTDVVDGFRLDRGFQLFLPAYPEARRVLDYDALNLRPFAPGALVWYRGRFHRLADPRANPLGAMASLFNPIGTARDKLRMAPFAWQVLADRPATDAPTAEWIRGVGGFTDSLMQRFFRPFLGGVFLESELATASKFFRFVFRMFSAGGGAIPAHGMQAIPDQIAGQIPSGTIRYKTRVTQIDDGRVELAGGESISTRAVVVATDGSEASRLIGNDLPRIAWNGSTTLYYDAPEAPIREPILMLNGDGSGAVNSVVVLSEVSRDYAPPGRSLISAAVIGTPDETDAQLDQKSRQQLTTWFGSKVQSWRLLRVDRIPLALPDQTGNALDPWQRPVRLRPGLYVCGDHRDQGSIDGAMTSGFRCAQALMDDLAARLT